LAQAINTTAPAQWWGAFNASYHELRATTRARQDDAQRHAGDASADVTGDSL
jgi:hypothetical protein